MKRFLAFFITLSMCVVFGSCSHVGKESKNDHLKKNASITPNASNASKDKDRDRDRDRDKEKEKVAASVSKEEIRIDGSNTIFPIVQKAAGALMDMYPHIRIIVRSSSCEEGIKALLDRKIQIAASSRPARDKEEVETGQEKGVALYPQIIAMDGILPIVHPSNEINNVSMSQLRAIFNGKMTNWNELGGSTRPISIVSRQPQSGTYDLWESRVLHKDPIRTDRLVVDSNDEVVKVVSKNPSAIGYIGLGYLNPSVRCLRVNEKVPTEEMIRSGEWRIARPLYLYTNGPPIGGTAKFLEFILSKEGKTIVKEVGFVNVW